MNTQLVNSSGFDTTQTNPINSTALPSNANMNTTSTPGLTASPALDNSANTVSSEWRNKETDRGARQHIARIILSLIMKSANRPAGSNYNPREIARRLEHTLYMSSSSREEYSNLATLKARLQRALDSSRRRQQAQAQAQAQALAQAQVNVNPTTAATSSLPDSNNLAANVHNSSHNIPIKSEIASNAMHIPSASLNSSSIVKNTATIGSDSVENKMIGLDNDKKLANNSMLNQTTQALLQAQAQSKLRTAQLLAAQKLEKKNIGSVSGEIAPPDSILNSSNSNSGSTKEIAPPESILNTTSSGSNISRTMEDDNSHSRIVDELLMETDDIDDEEIMQPDFPITSASALSSNSTASASNGSSISSSNSTTTNPTVSSMYSTLCNGTTNTTNTAMNMPLNLQMNSNLNRNPSAVTASTTGTSNNFQTASFANLNAMNLNMMNASISPAVAAAVAAATNGNPANLFSNLNLNNPQLQLQQLQQIQMQQLQLQKLQQIQQLQHQMQLNASMANKGSTINHSTIPNTTGMTSNASINTTPIVLNSNSNISSNMPTSATSTISSNSTTTTIPNLTVPPAEVTPKQRREEFRKRLIQLKHSRTCQNIQCSEMYCSKVKVLLSHVSNCADANCPTLGCKSTRQLLSHYRKCRDMSCDVCSAIRTQNPQSQLYVLRRQQDRLCMLRHASTCTAPNCSLNYCMEMKKLWKHICECRDGQCNTDHCISSRYVLSHFKQCVKNDCGVCVPVRQAIKIVDTYRTKLTEMWPVVSNQCSNEMKLLIKLLTPIPGSANGSSAVNSTAAGAALSGSNSNNVNVATQPTTIASDHLAMKAMAQSSNVNTATSLHANATAQANDLKQGNIKVKKQKVQKNSSLGLPPSSMNLDVKAENAAMKKAMESNTGMDLLNSKLKLSAGTLKINSTGVNVPGTLTKKQSTVSLKKEVIDMETKKLLKLKKKQENLKKKEALKLTKARLKLKRQNNSAANIGGVPSLPALTNNAMLSNFNAAVTTAEASKLNTSNVVTNNQDISYLDSMSEAQLTEHIQSLRFNFCGHITVSELKNRLHPLLVQLMESEYGWAFNTPVDPIQWNIPDYMEVIKCPMDLGTIKKRLENEHYYSLESFASDVRLTFENCIAYNSSSNKFNMAAKDLLKTFDKMVTNLKKELENELQKRCELRREEMCQLCGGDSFKFAPCMLFCSGPCGGRIRRHTHYYSDPRNEHHWCSSCYKSMKDGVIDMSVLPTIAANTNTATNAATDETKKPASNTVLTKAQLLKKKNSEVVEEPWVECDSCKLWYHQICALFNERNHAISGEQEPFVCPVCIKKQLVEGILPSTGNGLRANRLPQTRMANRIEKRVLESLESAYEEEMHRLNSLGNINKDGSSTVLYTNNNFRIVNNKPEFNITIREVLSVDKQVQIKPKMMKLFQNSVHHHKKDSEHSLKRGRHSSPHNETAIKRAKSLTEQTDVASTKPKISTEASEANTDTVTATPKDTVPTTSGTLTVSATTKKNPSNALKTNPSNSKFELTYRSRCICVFQELDGVDVLIFTLYVQEYGHNCAEPNRGRVYISYLDSVAYFQPKKWRVLMHQQVILGFLEDAKLRGYHTAHIWSCPPLKGDDYIFFCKPENQKIPKAARLRAWYCKLLTNCKKDHLIYNISNLYAEYYLKKKYSYELPYFEGDYWPRLAEDLIKQLEEKSGVTKGALSVSNGSQQTVLPNSSSGISTGATLSGKGTSKRAGSLGSGNDSAGSQNGGGKGNSKSKKQASSEQSTGTPAANTEKHSSIKRKKQSIRQLIKAQNITTGNNITSSLPSSISDENLISLHKSNSNSKLSVHPDPLMQKLKSILEPQKEDFFVVDLHPKCHKCLLPIINSMFYELKTVSPSEDVMKVIAFLKKNKSTNSTSTRNATPRPYQHYYCKHCYDSISSSVETRMEVANQGAKKAEEYAIILNDTGVIVDGDLQDIKYDLVLTCVDSSLLMYQDDCMSTTTIVSNSSNSSTGSGNSNSNGSTEKPKLSPVEANMSTNTSTTTPTKMELTDSSTCKDSDNNNSSTAINAVTNKSNLRIHYVQNTSNKLLQLEPDTDTIMPCEIFDTREAFLVYCQNNHCQFDQIRRSKHSSMMVLYHLFNQGTTGFTFHCTKCSSTLSQGNRWNCSICLNFNLCDPCKLKNKHEHTLHPFQVVSIPSPSSEKVKTEAAQNALADKFSNANAGGQTKDIVGLKKNKKNKALKTNADGSIKLPKNLEKKFAKGKNISVLNPNASTADISAQTMKKTKLKASASADQIAPPPTTLSTEAANDTKVGSKMNNAAVAVACTPNDSSSNSKAGSTSAAAGAAPVTANPPPAKPRIHDIDPQLLIHLEHASVCRVENCTFVNCIRMRSMLKHGATCELRKKGPCQLCNRILGLLTAHARQCVKVKDCLVPRCLDIRRLLVQQKQQQQKHL